MRFVLALLFGLLLPTVSWAEDAPAAFTPAQRAEIVAILRQALKTDPSILRDAVAALQAEEASTRQLAARNAIEQLGPALAATPGDPVAGNPQGDVSVVEFYDLRCPYCRRMLPVLDELLHKDMRVRLVYKDIPILGPSSVLGARAVLAAQRQGGYTRLQTALMQGSVQITDDSLHAAATRSGLDWDRLKQDMADPEIEARIRANLDLAGKLGVDGTPVFVVGKRMVPGAVNLAELQGVIAEARGR